MTVDNVSELNLETQKFPSHVIIVRKDDLLNVKEIEFHYLKEVNLSASQTTDLCNLEILSKLILFLYVLIVAK